MRKLLLSSVAVAAISIAADAPALAADMPVKAPAFKAAAPYDPWTGCYIGANIGGGWAHKEFGPTPGFLADSVTANPSGVAGGIQLGCDVQSGTWVFGARGMFDWSNMRGNTPFSPGGGKGYMTRIPWFATATGRAGYLVQPTLLIFINGGAAFVRDEFKFVEGSGAFVDATAHVTRTGWTVGGGVDWMVAPNWSVTIEYGYMGFGTKAVDLQGLIPNLHESVNQHVQVVLIGLNYRFGSGGGR
jgi:outer membrane immunogenic protein